MTIQEIIKNYNNEYLKHGFSFNLEDGLLDDYILEIYSNPFFCNLEQQEINKLYFNVKNDLSKFDIVIKII